MMKHISTFYGYTVKHKEIFILLLIIGIGAYLRIWHIDSQFNIFIDYDEGAYALGGKLISQGLIPYQDFLLVHPPLYDLLLAGIYKVFGYNFFFGRYLSIAISLFSIVIAFIIGRSIYNRRTGLLAAVLFAVSPDMIYYGRRGVQETIGIFFIMLAIYFVFNAVKKQRPSRLLITGIFLGLAVAIKYTFIPAVLGIFLATLLVLMGESTRAFVKRLFSLRFSVIYAGLVLFIIAFLFLLKWALMLPVWIPFFNTTNGFNILIMLIIFVLPFFLSVFINEKDLPLKAYLIQFVIVIKRREIWYLILGVFAGFIVVTGFFLVKTPQEFFTQTFALRQPALTWFFPSLTDITENVFTVAGFTKVAGLTIIFSIPVVLLLMHKHKLTFAAFSVAVALCTAILFCQFLPPITRYYVSVLPFLFLGLSFLVNFDTSSFIEQIKSHYAGLIGITAVIFLFFCTGIILLGHWNDYDAGGSQYTTDENVVYRAAVTYLESLPPENIYTANTIYSALSTKLQVPAYFDTYGLLRLQHKTAARLYQDLVDEGIQYIVIDYWIRYWQGQEPDDFVNIVKQNCQLLDTIEPDSVYYVEVYELPDNTAN